MNKNKFILALREKLSGLPKEDVEERLYFYSEMIDDRMEDGLSEEEAVFAIGTVDEIAAQILADFPPAKPALQKGKGKKTIKAWEVVLIVLGSPIWLSLLIAAFAVIFTLYVVLWSVIVSLWAVFVSLIACALGGIAAGIGFALGNHVLTGIALFGAGMVCIGLAIFLFFGCMAAVKGTLMLSKKAGCGIRNCFAKKEEA